MREDKAGGYRQVTYQENCLLCGASAIAVFAMSGGCIVYPQEKIQSLCPQHIIRATPLGKIILIKDLREDTSYAIPELGLPASE